MPDIDDIWDDDEDVRQARADLEAMMAGPIQRTNWMSDEPCPRCNSMTLATNGSGAVWCVDRACGYAREVKRGRK